MQETSGYLKDSDLYASWYPATTAAAALLMVTAFGEERKCCCRLLVDTARRLAAAGVDVLRFDLYGTGESLGSHAEGTLARWHRDLETAMVALSALSTAPRRAVLGARLGANLALAAAASADRLVLWAPLLDGAAYLDEMIRRKQIKEAMSGGSADRYDREQLWAESPVVDLDGYAVNAQLAREIAELDLMAGLNNAGDIPVLLLHITAARKLPANWQAIHDKLTGAAGGFRALRAKPFWGRVDYEPSGDLIDATVDYLLSPTAKLPDPGADQPDRAGSDAGAA